MAIKYKEEREALFEKLYEKKGFILDEKDLSSFLKTTKLSGDDFLEMIAILSQRGFIKIEDSIDVKNNKDNSTAVTVDIKSMSLTTKGLNYWEEKLEN